MKAQFAKKLAIDGIQTVGDIQKINLKTLVKRYGETGLWLHNCAFGRHERKVDPDGERKSVSSETTFNEDISDPRILEDILWRQCLRVADRAKHGGLEGRVVTLKLKTADFRSFTRRVSLGVGSVPPEHRLGAPRPAGDSSFLSAPDCPELPVLGSAVIAIAKQFVAMGYQLRTMYIKWIDSTRLLNLTIRDSIS